MIKKASVTFLLSTFMTGLVNVVYAAPMNLVTNGSFEQGAHPGTEYNDAVTDFPGWNYLGGQTFRVTQASSGYYNNYWGLTAENGVDYAVFSNGGPSTGISQNLTTIAGRKYNVSFYVGNGGIYQAYDLIAKFGSQTLLDISLGPHQPFKLESFTITADSSSSLLQFYSTNGNNPGYISLDDVVVTLADAETTVPEPGTPLLVGIGVLCAAFFAGRGRQPLQS